MNCAYQFIRDADFVSFAFTAGLIFYIGIRASARHLTVERVGKWLSALAFLTYVSMALSVDGYDPLEWIASYVFRGGFFAGLVLGTFCFLGSFASRTWQFIAPIPRYFVARKNAMRREAEAALRREQEAIDKRLKEEQRRRIEEEAKRRGEEYQRIQDEALRREAAFQRRRIQARAECELCYSRHVNEIEYRFPRSTCDAFLREYMNDGQPADEVEKRGKQLQQIIEHHARAAEPPKTLTSMEDVSRWYVEETGRIEQLPVDDELREFHRVQLNMRYAELTQTLLETMHP